MNKQEAIEKVEGNLMYTTTSIMGVCVNRLDVIDIIKKIDEPEKPVIPQFVADIIEEYKDRNAPIIDIFTEKKFNEKYNWWLATSLNAYDRTARAWLDGYEVEKEKLYTARLKIITNKLKGYINKNTETDCLFLDNGDNGNSLYRTHFTRAELEKLNIWNNPAFEVEEVE